MADTHIAVLMGGISLEHEVSLNSGNNVVAHLDPGRFRSTPVVIERDGAWRFSGEAPQPTGAALARLMADPPDCVFIALHGPGGEDGSVQGLLDFLGLPYTGSGCTASAIAIDKIRAKALAAHDGMPVPEDTVLDAVTWRSTPETSLEAIETRFGYPLVIKSPCQGSSLGMGIPRNREECRAAVADAFKYGDTVLAEQYVPGAEVTCGVLHVDSGEPPRALPVTEIRPRKAAFFDYHEKYTPGACEEITPAEIPEDLAQAVQRIAVRAHALIGCNGFSRSDLLIGPEGPVWIEINTIPGLTQTSLFPQAAAAAGISFGKLLELLIDDALRRHHAPSAQ